MAANNVTAVHRLCSSRQALLGAVRVVPRPLAAFLACRIVRQPRNLDVIFLIPPKIVIVGGGLRGLQSGDAIQRHYDVEDVRDFGAIYQGTDRCSMRPALAPIS